MGSEIRSVEQTRSSPATASTSRWRRWLKVLGKWLAWTVLALLLLAVLAWWYFHPAYELREGVAYTERNGAQLSYDVVTPPNPSGAAVLLMVSGSWKSGPENFEPWLSASMLRRGFTVFAISHQSQPKATVDEIVGDVNRAVRHIRYNAADYGIDPQKLAVTGGSSGGHLSLMLATRGGSGSDTALDPIDRESSAVQAAAVFFPVTDLVDLGPSTQNPGDGGPPKSYVAGFGFEGIEGNPRHISPRDLPAWKNLAHQLSPIDHLSAGLPPILIHHGDADTLVPLDQSLRFVAKAKQLGVDDRIELIVHAGGHHGWLTMFWDVRQFAKWFETQLVAASS